MKLLLENWRQYLNEERVDPQMKKYLDDHPYMEPDGLQEDELEERCQKGYKTHPTRKTKKNVWPYLSKLCKSRGRKGP